ncbi:MAG: 4-alpha-glucanotransferase, partial [Firmicutes bacterium]|nr:4-alpha-glucanotransferase [Bacillota bacterium]
MVQMTQSAALFSAKIQVPKEPCLLWYFFVANYGDRIICYGNNPESLGGEGCVYENSQPPSFQITVYDPFTTPAWYKDALVYQIFPDRFARGSDYEERKAAAELPAGWQGPSRTYVDDWYQLPHYQKDAAGDVTDFDFFGGTLNGIREKIPYLKSLGVTALYLNPIFRAASNHRYDTADYFSVDPLLGDENIFKELCEECRANGIRIILDGVFSHTGADSIYFDKYKNFERFGAGGAASAATPGATNSAATNSAAPASAAPASGATTSVTPSLGACHHENSPYRNWYRFKDEAPGYECWWGVADLPNVEETDPSYEKFICGDDGVLKHWLALGASGFRLDVADELPDSFIRSIHDAVKSAGNRNSAASQADAPAASDAAAASKDSAAATSSDNLLLGEVWEDASNKYSYSALRSYFSGHELDGVMNYPFRDHGIDYAIGKESAEMFCRKMKSLQENYPEEAFYSSFNLIGGHDCERILSVLGSFTPAGDDFWREDGSFVPAGSALPLEGDAYDLARRRLKMLSALQYVMPGVPCVYYGDEAGVQGNRDPDNRRTYPWGREDGDILYHYRMLGLIYRSNPVLREGRFAIAHKGNCLFVLRSDDKDMILTVVNASPEKKYFTETLTGLFGAEFKHRFFAYALELLRSKVVPVNENTMEIGIAGMSAMIIKLQKDAPKPLELNRASGVLCHLSSLPELSMLGGKASAGNSSTGKASSGNISGANTASAPASFDMASFDTLCAGALGKKGRAFIDWLAASGFKLWQMLPVNPVGAGNSPYFSPCVFAGDTRYIDWSELPADDGFDSFCEENAYWLKDWADYCRKTSTTPAGAAASSGVAASSGAASSATGQAAGTASADPEHAQYYFFTQLK